MELVNQEDNRIRLTLSSRNKGIQVGSKKRRLHLRMPVLGFILTLKSKSTLLWCHTLDKEVPGQNAGDPFLISSIFLAHSGLSSDSVPICSFLRVYCDREREKDGEKREERGKRRQIEKENENLESHFSLIKITIFLDAALILTLPLSINYPQSLISKCSYVGLIEPHHADLWRTRNSSQSLRVGWQPLRYYVSDKVRCYRMLGNTDWRSWALLSYLRLHQILLH